MVQKPSGGVPRKPSGGVPRKSTSVVPQKKGVRNPPLKGVPTGVPIKRKDTGNRPQEKKVEEVSKNIIEEVSSVPEDKPKTKKFNITLSKKTKKILIAIVCLVVGIVAVKGVNYYVINPPLEKRVINGSGNEGIKGYIKTAKEGNSDKIDSYVSGSKSWLAKERLYANNLEVRLGFVKKTMGVLDVDIPIEEAKTVHGKVAFKNGKPLIVESILNKGETVKLTVPDWGKILLEEKQVKGLVTSTELKPNDVEYSKKVTNLFANYILNLEEIPVKQVEFSPKFEKGKLTSDSEGELDSILFANDELWNIQDEFVYVTLGGTVEGFTKLKEKTDNNKNLPKLNPAWVKWSKDKSGDEPEKWSDHRMISKGWVGAYYNEVGRKGKEGSTDIVVGPPVGDGSKKQPAGVGTPVVTKLSGTKDYPIEIKLVAWREGKNAIDFFESKDNRNKGLQVDSKIKYISYDVEVVNLGKDTITVGDNSSLADEKGNLAGKTGKMYGLVTQVKIEPGKKAKLELWYNSVDISSKYLIWGADFNHKVPEVWFRVLGAENSVSETEGDGKEPKQGGTTGGDKPAPKESEKGR